MRYRRDIPRALIDAQGQSVVDAVAMHIAGHLYGATQFDDDPHAPDRPPVNLSYEDHPDDPTMVSLIGHIDAEPDAPYLRPGFDPAADHPEITFTPFELPDYGHHANRDAYRRWLTHGHHEQVTP